MHIQIILRPSLVRKMRTMKKWRPVFAYKNKMVLISGRVFQPGLSFYSSWSNCFNNLDHQTMATLVHKGVHGIKQLILKKKKKCFKNTYGMCLKYHIFSTELGQIYYNTYIEVFVQLWVKWHIWKTKHPKSYLHEFGKIFTWDLANPRSSEAPTFPAAQLMLLREEVR